MKKIVTLLFLFISFLGFGQQVNAPDPKEFLQSTAGQDASGFSLSGFSATSTLLASISLVNPPSGTTFYLGTTTGLTAASGFTVSGNKTKLVVTGTMASINTALTSLKINTGSVTGDINISVAATINPTGYYYNGTNGHFYRPISTGATYSNAKLLSSQQTFKGQTGYLVTITSADEDAFIFANVPQSSIWFALTDEAVEAQWRIDAGPEAGTLIKTSNGQTAGNIQGQYNNWAPGEPNNSGNEDYAVTKWGGGSQWNDLPNNFSCAYVVEFGTWTNPDDQTFTEFYNNAVTHTNGPDLSLKALFQFNFGSNLNESNFSTKLFKRNDATSNWISGGDYKALNGLGKVYLSNQLDTAKLYSSAIQAATQNDMTAYSETDIGKIYKMTITGASGGGWGTDIYTNDSYIPAMAVHAGVITIGQTKEVYIKVVEGKNSYPGSTRNGITTSEWGSWGLSYQFVNEPSSYKANTSSGQVEWCVIYGYDATNQRYRVGIDNREFEGTNVSPNSVSKLKLFDLWDGPVTYKSSDIYWNEYWIYTPTQFNFTASSYSSNIRAGNGFYGVSAEFSFAQNGAYKQHKLEFQQYDSVQLKSLYNSIVTVSDVWLAFKEVANTGIFGNEVGKEFGYGIQYKNADVNDDGYFNEADAFRLLQNLTGVKDLVNSYTLDNTMKIISDSTYATIGKSNWSQFPSYLGKEYGFSLLDGVTNYTYNLAVTWKGDVNLSHSATPPANGITNMSANFGEKISSMSVSTNQMGAEIITELGGDSVYAYITFKPGDNNIVGTQFQLNYDNSLLKFNKTEYITNGTPTNYSADKGAFVNVGSLNTDGSQITSATYKVIFILKQKLNGVLGLISVGNSEAVSKDGKSLIIKIN
jgi:hypothetical protein